MFPSRRLFSVSRSNSSRGFYTQLSQSPSVAYTTTDHLGTPRVITDQFGQVKARRDFMPFGEELYTGVGGRTGDTGLKYSSNQDDIRQKFTGYQKDEETQLDFAEARMYENRFGRFTAVDPLLASGKSANPQTFNRFIYVGNNPIMITDPLGLDWYRSGKKFRWSSDNKVFDQDGSTIGGDWTAVDFGSKGYYAYDCVGCKPGEKTYLYNIGGFDNGQRAAEIYDKLDEMTQLANSFNDPKYIAVRDAQVREGTSAAMWSGAAVLNMPLEGYNLAAWGANSLGGGLPYAPTISPDENTDDAGKFFFYGTNLAFGLRAGASTIGGVRNYFSLNGISQIRPNGAVNTLVGGGHLGQNATRLVTTEHHLKDLSKILSSRNGQRNLFSASYWKHVLPHRHVYDLRLPPLTLNDNWRKTFEKAGAAKKTIFRWQPLP